jgi:hypothetical protein
MNASKAQSVSSLFLPISSPQLTAAAAGNFTYVNLRSLGGIDVAVAPGRRHYRHSLFTLTFFILLLWRHWLLWARLLNFCSSPIELTIDVIALPTPWPASTWTSAVVCATIGCLYTYGLPLRLWPASTPTVIVIVHFLFKRNFYF